MKFAIVTGAGIDRLVDDSLRALPLNERLCKVAGAEEGDYRRVNLLPKIASFSLDCTSGYNIDVVGPADHLPYSFVASTEEERRTIHEVIKLDEPDYKAGLPICCVLGHDICHYP